MIGAFLAMLAAASMTAAAPVYADAEAGADTEHACYVTIEQPDHGDIKADIEYGEIGDIVTIDVDPNMFYLVSGVTVNGTSLVESEDTKYEYEFALAAGENKVVADISVDTELLGAFSDMYDEARSKDWTDLFSVENVCTIVKWVLDGGILIAIARYFIKDKKLAKSVEDKIQSTMNDIVPETTKRVVLENFKNVLTPMVSELQAENSELTKAMSVFAKCMALSQENTAESRKAILDELSGLKIGDSQSISDVKEYIEQMVAKQTKVYNETLEAIKKIEKTNSAIAGTSTSETKEEEASAAKDNGTQI